MIFSEFGKYGGKDNFTALVYTFLLPLFIFFGFGSYQKHWQMLGES
jgi:hypothetical protein